MKKLVGVMLCASLLFSQVTMYSFAETVTESEDVIEFVENDSETDTQSEPLADISLMSDSATEYTDIRYTFLDYAVGTQVNDWSFSNAVEIAATVTADKTITLTASERVSGGYDPIFYTPYLSIDSLKYSRIEVGLKWTGVGTGVLPKIYYKSSTNSSWSAECSKTSNSVAAESSDGVEEFVFDMSEDNNWTGTISQLRIDPADSAGVYELAYVNFCFNNKQIIYDLNGGNDGPENDSALQKGVYELSTVVPTRNGYKFVGWALSSDATTADVINSVEIDDRSVTVYAVWERPIIVLSSEFDNDNDDDGWNTFYNINSISVNKGIMSIVTASNDGRLQKTPEVPMNSEYCIMKVRYKKDCGNCQIRLRWQRTGDEPGTSDIVSAEAASRKASIPMSSSTNVWVE